MGDILPVYQAGLDRSRHDGELDESQVVYITLEGHFELVVGNATHFKQVPGRKTDIKDSEWIARTCSGTA
jgi:hypothetical protein